MRPIADIQCDDDLRLIPGSTIHKKEIIHGISVSGNEAFQAMPWLEMNEPIPSQLNEYLSDVSKYGAGGLSYHWAVYFHGQFAGLIALDYTPNLTQGHWNLGYWIQTPMQRKGIASRSIDSVLDWIGRGGLTSVEIHVDPENIAGTHTAESAIGRWNGHRMKQKVVVEVSGQLIAHLCWLIPRIPLEVTE